MKYKKPKVSERNLPQWELNDGLERERHVAWSNTRICSHCGDRMFYDKHLKIYFCRSWLYTEGGCPW